MPKIPRDHSEEMVARLLINVADVPEGLFYDHIEQVPEEETDDTYPHEQEEV